MDTGPEPHASCLSENTLAAFAEGHVDERLWSIVEGHLADCSTCRAAAVVGAGGKLPSVEESGAIAGDRAELPPGTRVGRYVIEELVGRGAMGTVYAATDPRLDRRVALKLLRTGSSDVARRRTKARLLREAKAMARLSHPEVIAVHDVDSLDDQLFVAMEYVEGETLRQWRAARHRSVREILGVYERAGSGLAAAHEAGLVHRDFKPDNVLVGRDGRVRVTDFGLARDAAHGVDRGDFTVEGPEVAPDGARRALFQRDMAVSVTRSGTLLGTPAYMAPEQLRGAVADARSDVFSFCVSLYEALYGERPFSGSSLADLLTSIENGAVRAPPMVAVVPRWLRAALLHGLRPNPDDRYPSVRQLLDTLRKRHARWRRRRFAGAMLACGASVAFGMALTAVYGKAAPVVSTQRPPAAAPWVPVVAPPPITARTVPVESPRPSDVAAVTLADGGRASWVATRTYPPRRGPSTPAQTPAPSPSSSAASSEPAPPQPTVRREIGHNGALILE